MNADVRYQSPTTPLGGFALGLLLPLAGLLSGCGAPEAEFSTSEAAEDLIPEARREVVRVVDQHFGEPDELVAWMRLPLAFGGVSGTVTGSLEDQAGLVRVLEVQFAAPAVLVQYDRDLDGFLTLAELPAELEKVMAEKRGSKTNFERTDSDGDGRFSADELAKANIKSEAFVTDLINPFTGQPVPGADEQQGQAAADAGPTDAEPSDGEATDEAVSEPTRIYFAEGAYINKETGLGQDMAIKDFNPLTGRIELAGALAEPPHKGSRVIVDFGSQLQAGRKHYMHHCMHCHGVTGDGNGPTAEYLNPRPRDYRQGIFKFTSTLANDPPAREDLHRIIREGIPGTYMPSFALLEPEAVEAVAEYVRWLSMRGNLELNLAMELGFDYSLSGVEDEVEGLEIVYRGDLKNWEEGGKQGETPKPPPSRGEILQERRTDFAEFQQERLPKLIDRIGDQVARSWRQAELLSSAVFPEKRHPPSTPESRARGRLLFLRNNCHTCHGTTGAGNGPRTRDFDTDPITKEQYPTPGLFDKWGYPIEPRNLHSGIYRGGRRPLDIYRRIHEGIPGTPMPPYGKLDDSQIWDLVNYVMSIPYEDMAPQTGETLADDAGDQGNEGDEPAETAETAALANPGR